MIRSLLLATALAVPADAGTLEGRLVTFTVMAWDDPQTVLLEAKGRTVTVGPGIEFGLEPEGTVNGLDIVPILVEIGPTRVEVSYPKGRGWFWDSAFNGYVLRFETECALFEGWSIDRSVTTLPVKDSDIFTEKSALYINVSGLEYGPEHRLAVDLQVAECPLS